MGTSLWVTPPPAAPLLCLVSAEGAPTGDRLWVHLTIGALILLALVVVPLVLRALRLEQVQRRQMAAAARLSWRSCRRE